MLFDREEHRQFLLDLFRSEGLMIPLALAAVAAEVQRAVEAGSVQAAASPSEGG